MNEGTRRRVAVLKAACLGPSGTPRGAATPPGRLAAWALALGALAIIGAAGSAQGSSRTGGVGDGQNATANNPEGCSNHDFGRRSLRLGDCGADVKTLNWLLRSKSLGNGVKASKKFGRPTDGGVRAFQRQKDLRASGVADRRTRNKLLRTMERDVASWYGPGLWGNTLACGGRLTQRTIGVAHKTLKCGTPVVFRFGDRFLRTRVIDRGPFIAGRTWDLTQRAARKLGVTSTVEIDSAVSRAR